MDRAAKSALVAELNGVFKESATVVVAHYIGLDAGEVTELRAKVREAGVSFKVTKNRLTRLALEGTDYEPLADLFTGPTAICYGDDPVAPAKVLVDFAKQNDKLVILGGGMGEKALDASGVKALATMPSLDELRGKLVGILQQPAAQIVGVLQAPGGQVARVLSAYSKEGEAA